MFFNNETNAQDTCVPIKESDIQLNVLSQQS